MEKQLAELTDANKDDLVRSSEAKIHTPSPMHKNRCISNIHMSPSDGARLKEAEEAAVQESAETMAIEKQWPNTFDVTRQSSK